MMNKSGKGTIGILAATVIGAAVAGPAFADYQTGPRGPMMGGGYGPGMMGQGMMGGGYGSGMMGGYGMGPGMMGMHEGLPGIALDDKQRKQFNAIQDELRRKRWELMGRTMDEQAKLRDLYEADKRDPAAIGAAGPTGSRWECWPPTGRPTQRLGAGAFEGSCARRTGTTGGCRRLPCPESMLEKVTTFLPSTAARRSRPAPDCAGSWCIRRRRGPVSGSGWPGPPSISAGSAATRGFSCGRSRAWRPHATSTKNADSVYARSMTLPSGGSVFVNRSSN